jgi:hypothetical protein
MKLSDTIVTQPDIQIWRVSKFIPDPDNAKERRADALVLAQTIHEALGALVGDRIEEAIAGGHIFVGPDCPYKVVPATTADPEKIRREVVQLLNEVNCRIEHGAAGDAKPHLEFIESKLIDICNRFAPNPPAE